MSTEKQENMMTPLGAHNPTSIVTNSWRTLLHIYPDTPSTLGYFEATPRHHAI